MKAKFGRLLTAMVSPFKEDLSVDYDKAQELADFLVENGSEGLVVSGTTGESPTLSDEEKIKLYKTVKEAVGNRVSVVAGTGSNSTRHTVELTQEAEKTGVDACMLVTPYYNKPPQKGLYEHFKKVAESTSLPVILYNVPSRTACNLEAQTTIDLSEIENIVAVKEASGDLTQISEIIKQTPDDFYVYSGEDANNFSILSVGGVGAISVASHIVGSELLRMMEAYGQGDADQARKIHFKLLPIFKVLFLTTNPIMVKAAVKLKGINVGSVRPPLVDASEQQIKTLCDVMSKINLL